MVSIETELREEFHRPDEWVQMPLGTIDHALRLAGRQRRRRRIGTTLGAVAVAAGLVVPTVALRHSGGQQAAAPQRAAQLVGAYEVMSGHSSLTDRLLDPATGKYVTAPRVDGTMAEEIQFSPDGRNVVFRPNTSDDHFLLESSADFAAGRVSNATPVTPAVAPGTLAGTAQWSRDSKSILLPYYKDKGKQSAGFSIYDVATHKTGSLVTLPSVDRNVIWGRSGNEIAGSDDALKASPANTVRFYSLTGKLRSQVTISGADVTADAVAKIGPFSPTGRYVDLASYRVYDLQTGRVLPQPTLPQCAGNNSTNRIGWYNANAYLMLCTTKPLVYLVGANGQVERTIKLPFGSAQMPNTSGGKVGKLIGITMAGTAGYPGGGGIRF